MIASIIITNIIIIIIIITNTVPIAPDITGTVLEPLAVVDTVVDETGILILVVLVNVLVAEIKENDCCSIVEDTVTNINGKAIIIITYLK